MQGCLCEFNHLTRCFIISMYVTCTLEYYTFTCTFGISAVFFAMGSFSDDELQTGMEQCGLDWSSEEVEIVDSMNEGTVKCEKSRGVSEASRGESLTFSLEPKLLRAASLQVVLSGWCKHWKGSHVECGEELFELSQPVQSIDVFLSHDWETSRWMKLLVMLLVFNSPAAAVASLLASIAVGVGQASGVVPENLWFFPFPCYWVYLLVLCFWQRIRGVWRHRMVFMDKLCIHQTDDKMKEVGILGLGAFVQQSDKLLVLWSQRYFNRLQLISVKSGLSFCSTDISIWSAFLPPPGQNCDV